MPFFSIIIPTYNRAQFIVPTIKSVLAQTYTDFELIIVDDASTDNTEEIIKSFSDFRIIYLKNEKNLERSTSRNIGIKNAKGTYICFLDSDDRYLDNHLEVLHANINKRKTPIALFLVNAYDLVNEVINERDCPEITKFNKYHFILKYTFNPPRMCVHHNIFKNILFDPHINICEDVDISLRIVLKYPIFQINERTVIYNLHPESFTLGDSMKPFKQRESYKKIFKKDELKGVLPKKTKNMLLSMTYYHSSIYFQSKHKYFNMYLDIIRSFILYPKGYNGKTNKVMLFMLLYHLPFIGKLIRNVKNKSAIS
ncbi:MAG TPA: glycosyltransferase [Bacteroidales bacterium]|nr:glycosyltransferase [Bacteroidales bacterium]